MEVPNPLTLEEKVSITRLIGHDILSQHGRIFQPEEDQRVAYARHLHVRYAMIAIRTLTQDGDCFYLSSKVNDNFDMMQRVFEGDRRNLSVELNTNEEKLFGDKHILYMAVYNLAKNGFDAMRGKGTVTLTVSEHLGGRIEYPIFIPLGAKDHGYFIKYDVHDTGEGFPADKPTTDSLQLGATTRPMGTGFGLHFAKLVSKYLQAPLAITSEPGNTHVTLYHPVSLGR